MGPMCRIPNTLSTCFIHLISRKAYSNDLYYGSAEEAETTSCFFVFHETDKLPRSAMQALKERQVRGKDRKSESLYEVTHKSESVHRSICCKGHPLR